MASEGDFSISQDKNTNLSFVFQDDKKFVVTDHIFKLSGFIRDIPESMHSDSAVEFPVKDFTSKSYEILITLLQLLKTKETKAYAMALKGETVSSISFQIYIYVYAYINY